MSRYGIEAKKILNDSFLENLISEQCISAYLLYKRINKYDPKKTKKLDVFLNNFREMEKEIINGLGNADAAALSQKLLSNLNDEIDSLPIRALSHPMNKNAINLRLKSINWDKTIGQLEKNLKSNKEFKLKNNIFFTQQKNILKRAIVWLNWFVYDEISNPLRPHKPIFSNQELKDFAKCESSDEIVSIIIKNTIKNNKRKIGNCFKRLDIENISSIQLINFLSSLSENSDAVLNLLKNRSKFFKDVRKAIYRNEIIEKEQMVFEKGYTDKLPIYYLSSFAGNISNYEKVFFKNGFRRISNITFIRSEFSEFFKSKVKTTEILEILKKSFSN